jgi:hypothetical protein
MEIKLDIYEIEKALEEYVEKHHNLKIDLRKDIGIPPLLEVQQYEEKTNKNGKKSYSPTDKIEVEITEMSWISFFVYSKKIDWDS